MNTTGRTRARQLAIVVFSAAALLVVLVIWRATDTSTLPERLATHYGSGGRPDGYLSQGGLLATALGSAAVGVVLATVPTFLLGWQAAMRRTLAGTGAGIAWLIALLYLTTLRENAGHLDAGTARMGAWSVILPLLAGLTAGVLVAVLTPAHRPGERSAGRGTAPADLPRRHLKSGERAVLTAWVGNASPFLWLLPAGLVALGLVMYVVNGSIAGAVIPFVIGVLTLIVAGGLTLQVDRSGVRVRLLGLPWPIARARLAQIESAEAQDLHPTEWGGWGYRITPHGRAVILRGGPGLVVHLDDGNHLAVSTDSAQQAAELVNGLLTQP